MKTRLGRPVDQGLGGDPNLERDDGVGPEPTTSEIIKVLKMANAELKSFSEDEFCEHDIGICWCSHFYVLVRISNLLTRLEATDET